jgi:2-deoxy-D-gluconate 3-dehydrogenase
MNQYKYFDLSGRVAMVTGCSRGIGMAIAKGLAEAGADIIGVSTSIQGKGSPVDVNVTRSGRQFWSYACDFSDRDQTYEFVNRVQNAHPVVDILFNNAGTILRKPAVEHADDLWNKVIEVNQTAPFILSRELAKGMIQRKYGKIIFTASLLSFQGGVTVPSYAASKGAVNQLVKSLANEWAPLGINVNAIAPGYIATDNTAALQADETRSRQIIERIPAGRWGDPDDFIGPAIFLASDASSYVHGTTLLVDGGWMGR